MRTESLRSKSRACLLGGAIGDALGAPIEFMSRTAIVRQLGAGGVTDFVEGDWPAGSIADDTQMTLFTAEGLIRAQMRANDRGIVHAPAVVSHAYLRRLQTQGERPVFDLPAVSPGLLLPIAALHVERAPGMTCLDALCQMTDLGEPPVARTARLLTVRSLGQTARTQEIRDVEFVTFRARLHIRLSGRRTVRANPRVRRIDPRHVEPQPVGRNNRSVDIKLMI